MLPITPPGKDETERNSEAAQRQRAEVGRRRRALPRGTPTRGGPGRMLVTHAGPARPFA
ncbi:MAG: hypothetical protein ACRDYA_15800 [Egibacteraceae bacterium]